ncbi:hypothetical protein ACHAXM_001606 [Skeletonema potamos]
MMGKDGYGRQEDVAAAGSGANERHENNHHDNANEKLLQKIALMSGNFRNYKEMKLKQLDTTTSKESSSSTDEQRRKDDETKWNHFTTPLKPSPTSQFSSQSTEGIKSKNIAITTTTTPSVFSNLERTQTIDRFGHIFMNRMGHIMTTDKLSTAWGDGGGSNGMFSWLLFTDHSPNATKQREEMEQNTTTNTVAANPKDYAAERRLITPHVTPFVWGTTCVAVTLLSMRLGRWYQGRSLLGRASTPVSSSINNGRNGSSSATAASNTEKNRLQDLRRNKPPPSFGHYSNNNNTSSYQNQKNALLTNLSTLPVDFAISLLVGISTSIFLSRPADLLQDFAKAPLLQGKSILREELCQPFIQEMDRINVGYHAFTPPGMDEKQVVSFQELWKDENIGEFDSLRAIRDFVENCHRNENVEDITKSDNNAK